MKNSFSDRKFFRKISVLAVASLALLALVQCVWTIKMYTDQKRDFVRRVESAAYKSIYKAFRMDAIPGLQAADMISMDLDEFALHFTPNLLELDITQPYVAEILLENGNSSDKNTGITASNSESSSSGGSNNSSGSGDNVGGKGGSNSNNAGSNGGNSGKVLMSYGNPDTIGEKTFTTTIPVDDDGMFALRVTISLPYKAFWGRMWGILVSSALIVVLLSGVLYYLVKTMFRQKNLEQMRQDFTHNITHELKTPISTASAATEALRNFSAEADPQRRSRYLQIIATQLEQLSTMVERILLVSVEGKEEKISKEKMLLFPTIEELVQEIRFSRNTGSSTSTASTACAISPTTQGVTESLQAEKAGRPRKEIEFVIDCPADLQVLADPLHFRNVLATVLDNAVKYSAASVENGKGDSANCCNAVSDNSNNGPDAKNGTKIHIRAKIVGGHTIIEVEDNGCGIAREHLPHIFEKYYRVPTGDVHQVRGYGLGLHYAQKVVGLHGGTISARSRLGYGTTIAISLPCTKMPDNVLGSTEKC